MYAATAGFFATLNESHTAIARLDVTRDGKNTTSFDVLDGTLTVSYDSTTRRAAEITVESTTLDSSSLADLLDPFLAVFHPSRGVRYPDGTEELIPCGEFFAENVELTESVAGVTARITAYDASTRCQGGLAEPFFIAAGSTPAIVTPELLARKMPGLRYRLASTPWTLPALNLRGQVNPWTKAAELWTAAGYDLTIARDGVCETAPRLITVRDEPVCEYLEGVNATFAGVGRKIGAEDYPNVVVVKGTNAATGEAIQGVAADMDPGSPTYRYGPTGERVVEVESEKVCTVDQANAMARVILARELGPQEQVTFTAIANPALDVPDIVAITRARVGLVQRRMIVTDIRMPWKGATMQITARRSILTEAAGVPVRI